MAASGLHPVALNQGLDLVTTPMLVEPGALIDCLNYEMTDMAGYRRIDGYEKYDGYPNGAIYDFYRILLDADNPAQQSLINNGGVISRLDLSGTVDVGVIVGSFSPNIYDIVPRDSLDAFITEESFLEISGGGFLALVSETDLLRIMGDSGSLGNAFIVTLADGTQIPVTVSSFPVSGRGLITDSTEFLTQLRAYGQVLRSLVQDAPSDVAGLYWYDDRLLAAVNAQTVNVTVVSGNPTVPLGTRLQWNGTIYRVLAVTLLSSGVNDTYKISMFPIGTTATINDNLVEVDTAGTVGTTWVTGVISNGQPSTTDSLYATLGYFNNPLVSSSRGFTYLTPSYSFSYDAGDTVSTAIPPITLDQAADPSGAYWVVGSDGAVFKVRLTQITQAGGSFTTGDATGIAQVSKISNVAGTRDYLKDNDEIHTIYPTTGTSRVITVNGAPSPTLLAGTGALKTFNSKYQWGTFNFYGQSSTLTSYGTTGASRAFWASKTSYGNIKTQEDVIKDMPRYLAFHANRLALGFPTGSVQMSAVGDAYNYSGVDGAHEIATGDDITGLLELPGDTLAVFGRRTIRKITGVDDSSFALGTISGNSGCFDYTACLVGSDAVFTNNHGVSTLQQTAEYGDFIGKRLSQKISNWLRPKLSKTGKSIEDGGVALAYTVRNKGQYRLVLRTGETITFSLNGDNPTIMFSNYALSGEVRVPFAWSSEVGVDGNEHIHVVWEDALLSQSVYEVDSGWGFNGKTFKHYFDLSPLFDTQAGNFIGIEKVRMFGTSYGIASLNLKTSGVETDFNQPYHEAMQDISMPYNPELLYIRAQPVTGIIDQANWGLAIKIRIQGNNPENSDSIEPPHTCQVLVLHVRTEGVED